MANKSAQAGIASAVLAGYTPGTPSFTQYSQAQENSFFYSRPTDMSGTPLKTTGLVATSYGVFPQYETPTIPLWKEGASQPTFVSANLVAQALQENAAKGLPKTANITIGSASFNPPTFSTGIGIEGNRPQQQEFAHTFASSVPFVSPYKDETKQPLIFPSYLSFVDAEKKMFKELEARHSEINKNFFELNKMIEEYNTDPSEKNRKKIEEFAELTGFKVAFEKTPQVTDELPAPASEGKQQLFTPIHKVSEKLSAVAPNKNKDHPLNFLNFGLVYASSTPQIISPGSPEQQVLYSLGLPYGAGTNVSSKEFQNLFANINRNKETDKKTEKANSNNTVLQNLIGLPAEFKFVETEKQKEQKTILKTSELIPSIQEAPDFSKYSKVSAKLDIMPKKSLHTPIDLHLFPSGEPVQIEIIPGFRGSLSKDLSTITGQKIEFGPKETYTVKVPQTNVFVFDKDQMSKFKTIVREEMSAKGVSETELNNWEKSIPTEGQVVVDSQLQGFAKQAGAQIVPKTELAKQIYATESNPYYIANKIVSQATNTPIKEAEQLSNDILSGKEKGYIHELVITNPEGKMRVVEVGSDQQRLLYEIDGRKHESVGIPSNVYIPPSQRGTLATRNNLIAKISYDVGAGLKSFSESIYNLGTDVAKHTGPFKGLVEFGTETISGIPHFAGELLQSPSKLSDELVLAHKTQGATLQASPARFWEHTGGAIAERPVTSSIQILLTERIVAKSPKVFEAIKHKVAPLSDIPKISFDTPLFERGYKTYPQRYSTEMQATIGDTPAAQKIPFEAVSRTKIPEIEVTEVFRTNIAGKSIEIPTGTNIKLPSEMLEGKFKGVIETHKPHPSTLFDDANIYLKEGTVKYKGKLDRVDILEDIKDSRPRNVDAGGAKLSYELDVQTAQKPAFEPEVKPIPPEKIQVLPINFEATQSKGTYSARGGLQPQSLLDANSQIFNMQDFFYISKEFPPPPIIKLITPEFKIKGEAAFTPTFLKESFSIPKEGVAPVTFTIAREVRGKARLKDLKTDTSPTTAHKTVVSEYGWFREGDKAVAFSSAEVPSKLSKALTHDITIETHSKGLAEMKIPARKWSDVNLGDAFYPFEKLEFDKGSMRLKRSRSSTLDFSETPPSRLLAKEVKDTSKIKNTEPVEPSNMKNTGQAETQISKQASINVGELIAPDISSAVRHRFIENLRKSTKGGIEFKNRFNILHKSITYGTAFSAPEKTISLQEESISAVSSVQKSKTTPRQKIETIEDIREKELPRINTRYKDKIDVKLIPPSTTASITTPSTPIKPGILPIVPVLPFPGEAPIADIIVPPPPIPIIRPKPEFLNTPSQLSNHYERAPASAFLKGDRSVWADLASVSRSLLKFGTATHGSKLRYSKYYGRELFGHIKTVEEG